MNKCQCPKCGEWFEVQDGGAEPQGSECSIAGQPIANAKKEKSVASLVLGLCGILAWIVPLAGFPVTITGLVLGCRKRYVPGIVLNVIFLVFTVVNSILGVILALQGKIFQ